MSDKAIPQEQLTLAALAALIAGIYGRSVIQGAFVGAVALFSVFALQNGWLDSVWLRVRPGLSQLIGALRDSIKKGDKPKGLGRYDLLLGKDMDTGAWFIVNLEQLKSIAFWAVNGGGKTTFLHWFIHELVKYHSPKEVKLLIGDLKDGLDFGIFKRLPHLAAPIGTTIEEVYSLVWFVQQEMERRAELFKGLPDDRICNGLERYHTLIDEMGLKAPRLPRLVMIIDEVQVVTENDDVTLKNLTDISRTGRAYGIHLVLSTQSPKVDAIPSILKSQLNTRFVGKMASRGDYFRIADVPKEIYDSRKLSTGQFFVSLGEWSTVQAFKLPDRELEKTIAEISKGHDTPTWEAIGAPERVAAVRQDFKGSNAIKRAKTLQFLAKFDEKPTAADFMAEFDVSEPTALKWINEYWTEKK